MEGNLLKCNVIISSQTCSMKTGPSSQRVHAEEGCLSAGKSTVKIGTNGSLQDELNGFYACFELKVIGDMPLSPSILCDCIEIFQI